MQKLLEYTNSSNTEFIIKTILIKALDLAQNKYGNYVIQNIIEKNNCNYINYIWGDLKGKKFDFSMHKHSSNDI